MSNVMVAIVALRRLILDKMNGAVASNDVYCRRMALGLLALLNDDVPARELASVIK